MPRGEILGELRLIGLFTSKAYAEPAGRVPILRRKLRQIIEAEDLIEGTHDYKAAVALYESFPKDDLFGASVDDLRAEVMGLLHLEERRQVKMFVRHDAEGRSVSITIALPRDRYNAELQQRLLELVQSRFGGESVDQYLSLGETELAARIHFTVHVDRPAARRVADRARARGDRPHPHVGRPAARAARRHLRRGARRPPGRDVPRAVPRLLQELHRHLDGAGRRRPVRAPRRRRAVPRRAAERARRAAGPDARRHLQDRRQGAAVRGAADSREPRPAGGRGGADAPQRRRRRDLPARLRRARRERPAARPRRSAASAWPTASRPSGTARPSPTRSTAWSSPPG